MAMKTKTGISRRGLVNFRISSGFPGKTNTSHGRVEIQQMIVERLNQKLKWYICLKAFT